MFFYAQERQFLDLVLAVYQVFAGQVFLDFL